MDWRPPPDPRDVVPPETIEELWLFRRRVQDAVRLTNNGTPLHSRSRNASELLMLLRRTDGTLAKLLAEVGATDTTDGHPANGGPG